MSPSPPKFKGQLISPSFVLRLSSHEQDILSKLSSSPAYAALKHQSKDIKYPHLTSTEDLTTLFGWPARTLDVVISNSDEEETFGSLLLRLVRSRVRKLLEQKGFKVEEEDDLKPSSKKTVLPYHKDGPSDSAAIHKTSAGHLQPKHEDDQEIASNDFSPPAPVAEQRQPAAAEDHESELRAVRLKKRASDSATVLLPQNNSAASASLQKPGIIRPIKRLLLAAFKSLLIPTTFLLIYLVPWLASLLLKWVLDIASLFLKWVLDNAWKLAGLCSSLAPHVLGSKEVWLYELGKLAQEVKLRLWKLEESTLVVLGGLLGDKAEWLGKLAKLRSKAVRKICGKMGKALTATHMTTITATTTATYTTLERRTLPTVTATTTHTTVERPSCPLPTPTHTRGSGERGCVFWPCILALGAVMFGLWVVWRRYCQLWTKRETERQKAAEGLRMAVKATPKGFAFDRERMLHEIEEPPKGKEYEDVV